MTNICQAIRKFHSCKTRTILKSIIPYGFKSTRQGNVLQTPTIIEHTISYGLQTIVQSNRFQIRTLTKSIVFYFLYALWETNRSKIITTVECVVTDADYTIGDSNLRNIIIIVKSAVANSSDLIGDIGQLNAGGYVYLTLVTTCQRTANLNDIIKGVVDSPIENGSYLNTTVHTNVSALNRRDFITLDGNGTDCQITIDHKRCCIFITAGGRCGAVDCVINGGTGSTARHRNGLGV